MTTTELQSKDAPFQFYARVHLRELTGLKAKTISELLEHLKNVPGSVVYHHTHHYLQQHQYLSPEPPNDFAYWVSEVLQEKKLGEKLASINTCDFKTIRSLREKIVETFESFLQKNTSPVRFANPGEEFYFIKSVSFIFPTPHLAHTLEEFVAELKKVTVDSIYYHMFEAKLRLEKGENDFSLWLDTAVGEKELARKISRLDPYTYTMESLREKIIAFASACLTKHGSQRK
jgi:hypothetical protein